MMLSSGQAYGSLRQNGTISIPSSASNRDRPFWSPRVALLGVFFLFLGAFLGFSLASKKNVQTGSSADYSRAKSLILPESNVSDTLSLPRSCNELLTLTFGDGFCQPTEEISVLSIRGLELVYYQYSAGQMAQVYEGVTPLIVINGGPGFSHNYLLTLKQQACYYGRTIIFYDQVGTGRSSRPTMADAPWLGTEDYYVEELRSLIAELNLSEVFVLGHSWGSVVSLWYALEQPPELKGLVLAGALSDAQLYAASQLTNNLATIPPHMLSFLVETEQNQKYGPDYDKLSTHLEGLFTVRTYPIPSCLQKEGFDSNNKEIYQAWQGPSEFQLSGLLMGYNVTARLSSILAPTLITHGAFDTITPPVVNVLHAHIKDSRVRTYAHSGHITMIDDVEAYNNDVAEFLKKIDDGDVWW